MTPYTYLWNGAIVVTNSLFRDAQNNSDAVFLIKIWGALSTCTLAKVILVNAAQAKNIYWIVNGAIAINIYSEFSGTIIANNGAVNGNTGASLKDEYAVQMML